MQRLSARLKIPKLLIVMPELKDEKRQTRAVKSTMLSIQLKEIMKKRQN